MTVYGIETRGGEIPRDGGGCHDDDGGDGGGCDGDGDDDVR